MQLNDRERELINKLPSKARRKFWALFNRFEGLAGAARARAEQRSDLRKEIEQSQEFVRRNSPVSGMSEIAEIIARENEKISSIKRDIAEIGDVPDDGRSALASLIRGAVGHLEDIPSRSELRELSRKPAQTQRGETFATAIERCRDKIASLRAEIEAIERAPLPSGIALEMVRHQVNSLADRGKPDVTQVARLGGQVEWPTSLLGTRYEADAHALLAWLHRDTLLAKLEQEVLEAADDANAIAPADRKPKIKKIEAQILDIERDEVSFIDQAAAQGMVISPRGDTNFFAFFGLSEELKQAPPPPPYKRQPQTRFWDETAPKSAASPAPANRDPVWQ